MNDLKANRLKVSKLLHAALLAAVTFFIIYQSIYSMRANAWYFNARNTLQLLATSQNTETVLVTAKQAMILATELDPCHPHYWQLYAHITLLRLSAGNTQDDVIKN